MDTSHYQHIQNIALKALIDIKSFIHTGATEKSISENCIKLLEVAGIKDCWYHNIPAFILAGDRSTLSVSGRQYEPSDIPIREQDIVTIDLSPEQDGYWGDCARTYIVENGKIADIPNNSEFANGIKAEKLLHTFMQSIATPSLTMHDLYRQANAKIEELGYENLDFQGNLGHSIEKHIDRRLYIESSNQTKLGDVPLFTFEPHIRRKNGKWGFKRENIYYFKDNKAIPLGDLELLEAL